MFLLIQLYLIILESSQLYLIILESCPLYVNILESCPLYVPVNILESLFSNYMMHRKNYPIHPNLIIFYSRGSLIFGFKITCKYILWTNIELLQFDELLALFFTCPLHDLYHTLLTFWTHSASGSTIVVCMGPCWTVRGFGTSCGAVFGCRANNLRLYARSGGAVVPYK